MAMTLSQLFGKTQDQYDIKLIAGKSGMENTVRWVHMVEDAEVPDFLHGNELIFTTGIAKHADGWLLEFVRHLDDNNAAGLIVNIGPYVKEIPPQVIVYCEQNSFPLFTMPWKTRIIDVSYELCRRIINNEKKEQSLAEAFKNLIIAPADRDGYAETLKKNGFGADDRYTIILVKITGGDKKDYSRLITEYSETIGKIIKTSPYHAVRFVLDKCFIIIRRNCSDEDTERIIKSIAAVLSGGMKMSAGISEQHKGWQSVPNIYSQAKDSLYIAGLRDQTVCRYSELDVEKLLLNVKNRNILREFHSKTIGKLLDYDSDNGTDYYKLLKEYMLCGGSIQEIASNSGVHRNTVNYKIKQIKEILGTSMTAEDKMKIMLAYEIAELIL